jgi:hypothetical protein
MPPSIGSRTTNERRPRDRGPAAALAALLVAAMTLWGGDSRPLRAQVADGLPVFFTQTPPILRPNYTGTVQLEIVYTGVVPDLRVFYFRLGNGYLFDQFPPVQTSTIGTQTVTIFRPSWTMGEFVRRFGLTIDFDGGIGGAVPIALSTVPRRADGFPTVAHDVFMRAMSATVGSVPVVQIDATAQYSSHVVNLVVPGLANSLGYTGFFDDTAAGKHLYSYFGDDYEILAFVFREGGFINITKTGAWHVPIQNQISGINLGLYNYSAMYGSAGRLEGSEAYATTLSNTVSNHELSHQWGSYFDFEDIAGIVGGDSIHTLIWGHHETPLNRAMGSNLRLRPLGGPEWEVERAPEPTQMPPLLAYAMGRLPASAVPPMDIFEDQSLRLVGAGQRVSGPTKRVTIDQIIAHHGPRVGPTVTTVRRATVLVSRHALATPEEMAFWTLVSQRQEDPHQTGMINEQGIGAFRAISGVTLNSSIIPPAGGPVLPGHATLEPDVLDRRDVAGVVLDAAPRLVLDGSGIFRMKGRIVASELAGAATINVQHGGNPSLQSSPVAPDGSFSIMGSPGQAPGRYMLRAFLNYPDGSTAKVAEFRNVQYLAGVRVPPPPVALTATAAGNSVSIQWAPDSGSPPTTYFLDVGSSSGATNIGSFPMTATALSASGVPNGRYYVRVRAANTAGVSGPSAEAVLDVGGCASPQPPTMLTFTVTGGTLALGWQPSATPGVSYTVIAGSTSGESDIGQAPLGAATSLTAPGVPPGRYFIRVRAVTACGSADSNEVDVVVGAAQAPGAPANLTVQVNGPNVSFSWLAASGATGYVIEAGLEPGSSNLAIVPVGNVLTLSAPGVPPGTYYVRVRAVNAAGQGPPSNEVAVTVP